MKNKKLTDMELDALKEVANIGAGNAAIAVSQILNMKVDIDIPSVSYSALNKVPDLIGDTDKVSVGVYFEITGDLKGYCLMLIKENTAFELINALMGVKITKSIDSQGESAIKETGNILLGSYLNAMADFLELRILPSVPALSHDYVASMLNQILSIQSQYSDDILVSLTKLSAAGKDYNFHMIIIFDPKSMKKTVDIIDKKLGLN